MERGFRGVVSVCRKGKVLLRRASGFAHLADRVPNAPDTRFATASAGKAFVATGILKLVSEGRLGLEDELGALIPMDWEQIDPRITVRQLLTHTSGIPDYFDESVMDEYEALWTDFPNYRVRRNADLLPLFLHRPMTDPPGRRFQYNNTGYVVLAMIIEAVTGQLFDAFLKAAVFEPARMERTGYFELDALPEGCADSYIWDEARGGYRTNIYSVDAKGTGAGGAFTTAGDVERFWQALFGGRLIPMAYVAQMSSVQARHGEERYGFGLWIVRAPDGRDVAKFEGCDPGASFVSTYDPEQGLSITALSNYCDDVWSARRTLEAECEGMDNGTGFTGNTAI